MEELIFLSRQYYRNTVQLKFFGLKGWLLLVLSIILLVGGLVIFLVLKIPSIAMVMIFIVGILWAMASVEYDKRLVVHLSYYTHSESKNISSQKKLYLELLVYPIAKSISESLKILNELVKIYDANQSIIGMNVRLRILNFIYNPDSKNRILSLVIYFISLISLLVVVKQDSPVNIFDIYSSLDFWGVLKTAALISFVIVMLYISMVIPVLFLYQYVIVRVLLWFSSEYYLPKFFMSELSRYAFYGEDKI